MEFNCKRCGYTCERKDYLISHLKRKTVCNANLSDISQDDLLSDLKREYNEKTYKCDYCDKEFNSRSSKSRHKKICKKRCDVEQTNDGSLHDKIKVLEQHIEDLSTKLDEKTSNQIINTTNNNNNSINNNIQQNIINVTLKDFGRENMEAIPQSLVADLFLELQFKELLENLHCDPNFPENHNIRIKSVKRNVMEVYRNNKWDLVSFVNGLDELLLQGHRIFVDYYKKNKQKILEDDMSESDLREILRQLDRIEELNKEDIKPLHEDLKLMLEGNRHLIANQ